MTQEGPPIDAQRRFWNDWNTAAREQHVGPIPRRQADVIAGWLPAIGRTDLEIIDVGCGTGWLCELLIRFGHVTATDLANEVISRAAARHPHVRFIAGDFMTLQLPTASFDVVTTLEVLSHVADRPAFIRKLARLLRPNGILILATQNRFVLDRTEILSPNPGQIRHWVHRGELLQLLKAHFSVERLFSVSPAGHGGILRLVNSPKLNRALGLVLGERRITTLKESAGLGWTLMALARKT